MFYKNKAVVEFQAWRGKWAVAIKADDYHETGTAFLRLFKIEPSADEILSVRNEAEERWAVAQVIEEAQNLALD
jgi:hypothetical protein